MPIVGGVKYAANKRVVRGKGAGKWKNVGKGPRRGQTFRTRVRGGKLYNVYGRGANAKFIASGTAFRAPSAPRAAAPKAVAKKPVGPAAPTKPPTTRPAPDPRDSAYWQQLSKLRFQTEQEQAKLTADTQYATQDFTEGIRRMVEQKPRDEQAIRQTANREGLLFSGQLGKRIDDFTTQFERQRGDTQRDFDRAEAARKAARSALEQGASLDQAALYAEAVERASDRDAENPPDVSPLPGEEEYGDQMTGPGKGAPKATGKAPSRALTHNSAVRALKKIGVKAARGLGGGKWRVQFSDNPKHKRIVKHTRQGWFVQRGKRWVKIRGV